MRERSALLLRQAHDWEGKGAYAAAIKCLTPVCEDASELPNVAAAARLHLARLLLTHFDNLAQAKTVLLAAVGGMRRRWWGWAGGAHFVACTAACTAATAAALPAGPLRSPPTFGCMPPCLPQEQQLRETQGNHLLKCEVADALALANQRLGKVQAEADALAAGLKACRAGAGSKDK